MQRTDVLIVGAGQAGLAMSCCLSDLGIEHIVVERGDVANRWRTDGWDSLRLLTPNWMTRLPGRVYAGDDPDGFMTARELLAWLEQYARSLRAPIETHTTVLRVRQHGGRYCVITDRGTWSAANVVIATGYCDRAAVPAIHRQLTPRITQIVPRDYRHPGQLPPGGVLVVGASATGIQIADELQQSGRDVTIAVGQHTRLPRTYRGRDILWWLDRMGVLSEGSERVYDIEISRQQPSLQLVGRPDRSTLDLGVLRAQGVRVVGRLRELDGRIARFEDDLFATTAAADFKLAGILQRVDAFIEKGGMNAEAREPFRPVWPLFRSSQTSLDLEADGIETVIWATGYRRDYSWLDVPVLDARGEIVRSGGITGQPGLYVLGLNFLRRRNSSFIAGVGDDARELAADIASRLAIARTA